MAKVSIELRTKKLSSGEYPVILRIRHKSKVKVLTLFSLNKGQWNDKTKKVKHTHSRCDDLNRILKTEFQKIDDRIFELNRTNKDYTLDQVFDYNQSGLLSEEIERYILELKDLGKNDGARKIKNLKDHILKYGDSVIDGIDLMYLKKFANYLKGLDRIKSLSTVSKYIVSLQSVLKRCNVDIDFYITPPPVYRSKLTLDELDSIEAAELKDRLDLSRDVFLTCFYTGGSRISEVLRMLKPVDGQCKFLQAKNSKPKLITLNSKLINIFEKYEGELYALPVLKLDPEHLPLSLKYKKHIESKTATINSDLKVIAAKVSIIKKLTTHVARHSFAAIAEQKGLTLSEISALLDHSSIRTTETYLRQLRNEDMLNDLRNKVFDF